MKTIYLFDSPLKRDWMFWTFCFVLFRNVVGALQRVSDSGGINLSPNSIFSGLVDASLQVFLAWFIFLPIYFIRQYVRKRKIMTLKDRDRSQTSVSFNELSLENSRKAPIKNRKTLYVVGLIVIVLFFSNQSIVSDEEQSNRFFEVEQNVSKHIKEWNLAATPISQIVSRISNGTISELEARQIASEASTRFAIIHNNLRIACDEIPNYDLSDVGQSGAIALSYDALQVTCDVIPQESIEILALVSAQLSPTATQQDLDYHLNQISLLIEKRRLAIVKSIDALEPFANQAEKDQLARLKVMLE